MRRHVFLAPFYVLAFDLVPILPDALSAVSYDRSRASPYFCSTRSIRREVLSLRRVLFDTNLASRLARPLRNELELIDPVSHDIDESLTA